MSVQFRWTDQSLRHRTGSLGGKQQAEVVEVVDSVHPVDLRLTWPGLRKQTAAEAKQEPPVELDFAEGRNHNLLHSLPDQIMPCEIGRYRIDRSWEVGRHGVSGPVSRWMPRRPRHRRKNPSSRPAPIRQR